MPVKMGISGCRRGRSFLKTATLAGFEVWAVIDPDEDTRNGLGEASGVPESRRFSDYNAMLDSGVEVVLVSSPMPYHAPQAVAALKRDIHVLSEVTAATSLQQCLRLRDTAQASSATYMMAENYTYRKPVQLVMGMVEAGLFGDVYYTEGQYLHNVRDIYVLPDGGHTWRGCWQLSRRGLTYPTHSIGPALKWMKERVVSLSARGSGTRTWNDVTGDDSAVMLCQTASGKLVNIRTDLASRRPHNMTYYQLQGTKGCYEAPRGLGDDHKVWLLDYHGDDENSWHSLWDFEEKCLPEIWRQYAESAAKAGHGGGDLLELVEFAEAIGGESSPDLDVYTALDWTMTALISELSVEQGGASLEVPNPRNDELDRAAAIEAASGRFTETDMV
jgi:predicted dehydrogenase